MPKGNDCQRLRQAQDILPEFQGVGQVIEEQINEKPINR